MFNEIRIENFKCFADMQKIPLKPITLLYGPNSSGKSSVLQSFLLFKQTLEASGNEEIVLLPKGDLVDLGGYSEFVNGHDNKKEVTIGFSFKHLWRIDEYGYSYYDDKTDSISLEFTFIAVPGFEIKQKEILVKSIKVFDRPDSEPVAVFKNVWLFPKLRRAIMRKIEEAKRDKDDPAIVQEWVSDLRRSVMVLESIGLEPHGWTNEAWSIYQKGYGSQKKYKNDERLRRFKELGMKFSVGSGLVTRPILLDAPDGTEVRLSMDDAMRKGDFSKDDEEFFRKLNRDRQPGLVEEINKLKTQLKSDNLKEVERKKIKQAVRVLKKVDKSLFTDSFEEFSNIKECSVNNLIYLRNCMPKEFLTYRSKEYQWLLQGISELEELTGLENLYWEYTDMIPDYLIIWAADWLLSGYIKNIQYIGPLREFPERVYSYSGNVVSTVGKSGKFTPDILFARPETKEKVNHWLDKFDTGYELDVKTLMGDLFAILLRDKETKCEVSPKDVGFGISQLLPIIVQGVTSRNNIICIEQPEIHVHPRLQAELGSFFVECADKYPLPPYDNDFPPTPGNQFIIETHSEHLILRLLRRIRETTNGELAEGDSPLRPEDVAVIYAKPTEKGTELMELRITEDGDFADKWPDGFFTERAKELF